MTLRNSKKPVVHPLAPDPNSRAAKDALIRAAKEELERRRSKGKGVALSTWDPEAVAHPGQIKVLRALDQHRFVCVVTGRRWGKTMMSIISMLSTCFANANNKVCYIGTSRSNAYNVVWKPLCDAVRTWVPGADINESRLQIRMPNGSSIMTSGVTDASYVDNLRGAHFELVVVDEAKDYGPLLEPLIQETLKPTLVDRRGKLLVIGTPAPAQRGFFNEIFTNKHGFIGMGPFDLRDNPFIADEWSKRLGRQVKGDELLELIRADAGYEPDDPSFLREYLGQWARDDRTLVYSWSDNCEWNADKNPLPPVERLTFIMGVDTGYRDNDAIVVLAFDPTDTKHRTWLVAEHVMPKQGFTELATAISELNSTLKPASIVIDPAGGGSKFAEDMSNMFGINLQTASKSDRNAIIALINDDMRHGRLLVSKNVSPETVDDMLTCTWIGDDPTTRSPQGGRHSDVCDALRYAWRERMRWRSGWEDMDEHNARVNLVAKALESMSTRGLINAQAKHDRENWGDQDEMETANRVAQAERMRMSRRPIR